MISTKQLFVAGLREIANSVTTLKVSASHRFCCIQRHRVLERGERRATSRRVASGKVKKICRGKEDKGLVSREAKRLSGSAESVTILSIIERESRATGIGPFDSSSVRVRSSLEHRSFLSLLLARFPLSFASLAVSTSASLDL